MRDEARFNVNRALIALRQIPDVPDARLDRVLAVQIFEIVFAFAGDSTIKSFIIQ